MDASFCGLDERLLNGGTWTGDDEALARGVSHFEGVTTNAIGGRTDEFEDAVGRSSIVGGAMVFSLE
jgi:hypothetical protein